MRMSGSKNEIFPHASDESSSKGSDNREDDQKEGTLIDPIEEVAKESVETGEDEGKVKVGTSEAVEEKDE